MGQQALKQIHLEYSKAPKRFAEHHTHPWLILSPEVRPKEDLTIRTTLYNTDGTPIPDDAPEALLELKALEVEKRPINAFGLGITLGRTRNNDIVVNDERISRFHAFFRLAEGSWLIADAGSKNGTFLYGVKVDPRKALDFGGYRARFFLPAPFLELLRKLGPART